MQSSGRVLVASTRHSLLRLARHAPVRTFYSKPPPSLFVSQVGVQRRGYRRSTVVLKDEDSKRHKSTKDVENKEKQTSEDQIKQKFSENVDTPENDQDAKLVDEATESTKETNSVEETSSGKEKRTREPKNQKTSEETTTRPAIISRNQALSLVANGNKSRLIITNHDHPETYPQCMALAMSGRPILPGFYSTSVPPLV